MSGWIAFGVLWFFCGVANLNAYADELDFNGHKPDFANSVLCIALGPISTIVGTTARAWSWVTHRQWARPHRTLNPTPQGDNDGL